MSSEPPAEPRAFLWSLSQRRGLLLFLWILIVVLAIRIGFNRQFVSDQPDAPAPRAAELADRVDPNTADWQTLAAIPTLGQNRAIQIVAYRARFAAEHPGAGPAFASAMDLMCIKGIGTSMVANLEPYLLFPPPRKISSSEP